VQRVPPDERATAGIFPENDGPERIEPDLWRIPLPLPFALRSANVYLLGDVDQGYTLVDSGFGLPADEAALRAGLEHAGVRLDQITALILTHAHPDHIGLSGPIHAAANSCPVYMLAGENSRMFDVWREDAPAFAALDATYAANGLSADDVRRGRSGSMRTRAILRLPPPSAVRTLEDGEELRLGGHAYQVIWTPGHSDYHMCLLRDDGLFIAGDHILPGITPNIGWYPNARPDPLGDYYAALERVRDLPARLVLPGHRRPFAALAQRVDELRDHHIERAERILGILAGHPGGLHAMAVAKALFGGRLTSHDDRRFALAETLAHLEHLLLAGRITREEREGIVRYSTVGGVVPAALAR
jgi:glyoxylase-like metal-dependent hydrolase (beta-lactamase superfamily II)